MSSITRLKNIINIKYNITTMFNKGIRQWIHNNSKDNPYIGFSITVVNLISKYPNLRIHDYRIRKFIYVDIDSNVRYTFYVKVARVIDTNSGEIYTILPGDVKPCCNYVFDTIKQILLFVRTRKFNVTEIIDDVLARVNHQPNENASCHHFIIWYWLNRMKDNTSHFYRNDINGELQKLWAIDN